MPAYRRVSNEKGFVLVLALFITAILLLMAVTLSNSIDSYLRIIATTKEKNQTYYTAYAGFEQLRASLMNSNANPGNDWGGFLASTPTDSSYQNRTSAVAGSANPVFPGTSNNFQIFFRDNGDGDDTYVVDNDEIVMASVTAQDPSNNTKTTVEAMLIFNPNAAGSGSSGKPRYKMAGEDASRSNVGGPGPSAGAVIVQTFLR